MSWGGEGKVSNELSQLTSSVGSHMFVFALGDPGLSGRVFSALCFGCLFSTNTS